jgi:very-short-patch-repair endonuclease
LGVKFRRQVPIGPYNADFLCKQARLIIEADGGQHGDAKAYDTRRVRYLEAKSYTLLRFWNHQILEDTDSVIDTNAGTLHWSLHPENPLAPLAGRGGHPDPAFGRSRTGSGSLTRPGIRPG